jgi:NitT/TauT family transport system substrate-binding protein
MKARHVAAVILALLASPAMAADLLKIASPQRGSWEGAIPELGRQQGIFQKHGLDLDILYTAGGGETLQAVISGAVDIGLSAGTTGVMGAFSKNAPIRIIGASSTGSRELFWYVLKSSALQTIRDAKEGTTIAYSTTGASTHISVLHFIADYGLKAKAVATGDISATITQAMSGQVDVGWSVAPFNLDPLAKGEIRLVARASDIERIRSQTIRVQIANLATLEQKKDAIARYRAAYQETLDWMYTSPEAVARKRGQAHARRVHPQGEPADRQDRRDDREHAGRDAVQVSVGPAHRRAAQGADPDSSGAMTASLLRRWCPLGRSPASFSIEAIP